MVTQPIKVLAVSCSPSVGGKTRAALEAVLAGAAGAGAETSVVEVGAHETLDPVLEAIAGAEAFVFGSPMYRATYAYPFKDLLDRVPRGLYGEGEAPLTGHATLTVATAASDHHLLGMGPMRDVLVDFFGAHVVSPGLYLTAASYDEGSLTPAATERASMMGLALVELATAIRDSTGLRAVTPNA